MVKKGSLSMGNALSSLRMHRLSHDRIAFFKLFPLVSALMSLSLAIVWTSPFVMFAAVIKIGFAIYGVWMARRVVVPSDGAYSAYIAGFAVFLFCFKGFLDFILFTPEAFADGLAFVTIALMQYIWHYSHASKFFIVGMDVKILEEEP